jgi:hypothetical protein
MAKNIKKFYETETSERSFEEETKLFRFSQQHQSKTKAQQSLMTMLKKLGQLDTIIKLLLLASA